MDTEKRKITKGAEHGERRESHDKDRPNWGSGKALHLPQKDEGHKEQLRAGEAADSRGVSANSRSATDKIGSRH